MNRVNEVLLELPENVGFRNGDCGVHSSRDMMLDELKILLTTKPADSSKEDYRKAIIEENVLSKKTAQTRRTTAKKMCELYTLDPKVVLFRILRFLWDREDKGRPLLACLCAHARDPILRMTSHAVLSAPEGAPVSSAMLAQAVNAATSGRFYPSTVQAIGSRAVSSWTQSGHLNGRQMKIRRRAQATPANTAYALFLGYLTGVRGSLLFETYWAALLDIAPSQLDNLAFDAAQLGWLDYRKAGNVTDISFVSLMSDHLGGDR